MRILTMTDDLQEIDGVGPSREDDLNDKGYETYDELAEADYEELAENVNHLSEDKALDLVVQAQNLADLEGAEVSSGDGLTDDEADSASENDGLGEDDAVADAEAEDEAEEKGEPEYEVLLDFDGAYEYDTFYHTLIEERCALRRTNRTGVETYDKMLASMRDTSVTGEFSVEMTENELNDLHNAVMEQRYDYQGENLIDYMDALRQVEENVNSIREEFLF